MALLVNAVCVGYIMLLNVIFLNFLIYCITVYYTVYICDVHVVM